MGEREALAVRTDGAALRDFVGSTGPWTGVQVELAPEVTAVGRIVAVANLATAGWALVVLGAGWACSGLLCAATTMGGRPALLLGWSLACALAAADLASGTRGLQRVDAGQLAALVLITVLGAVAALGAVIVLVLAALAVTAAVNALLILIERL
jgi:hypothetical protein